MGWRLRSIRQRILLLVLVLVLSLIGLYIFATAITAGDAINLARTYTLRNAIGRPAGNFLGAIDVERPLAALYLAAPTPTNMAALKAVEAKSDGVIAALRSGLASGGTTGNESVGPGPRPRPCCCRRTRCCSATSPRGRSRPATASSSPSGSARADSYTARPCPTSTRSTAPTISATSARSSWPS